MALANRGLAVFPVDPQTKAPKTQHGCKDATRSEASIIQLWRKWPSAGIGVATGKPSGLVVVDVDPSSGGEDGFSELASKLGAPGRTVQVRTPRGGYPPLVQGAHGARALLRRQVRARRRHQTEIRE